MATTPRGEPQNDIYTGLIVIAFLFLLAATVYVGYRAVVLFGSVLPPPGG